MFNVASLKTYLDADGSLSELVLLNTIEILALKLSSEEGEARYDET